jgi:hypothetical protein
MRPLRFLASTVLFLIVMIQEITAAQTVLVRVFDPTGAEGLKGIVLVVRPDQSHEAQAYVTGSDGRAYIQYLDGHICTVTAIDPAGLFLDKTTEFNCRDSPVTIELDVRPILDTVSTSYNVGLKIRINGPDGKPLPSENILIRPAAMSLDPVWTFLETTDSSGLIDTRFSPGEYVIAAIIHGDTYEASLVVTATNQKCPDPARNCISVSDVPRGKRGSALVLHLVAVAGGPR